MDDGIPNQKEKNMARAKSTTNDEPTKDETSTASTESSSENSSKSTEETSTKDAHVQADEPKEAPVEEDSQKTAASGFGDTTTGIDGDAFPDRPEFITSEDQTQTVVSTLSDVEYQQPKFRAVKGDRTVGISLYGWVGPEAIVISNDDLEDFKAFVASL